MPHNSRTIEQTTVLIKLSDLSFCMWICWNFLSTCIADLMILKLTENVHCRNCFPTKKNFQQIHRQQNFMQIRCRMVFVWWYLNCIILASIPLTSIKIKMENRIPGNDFFFGGNVCLILVQISLFICKTFGFYINKLNFINIILKKFSLYFAVFCTKKSNMKVTNTRLMLFTFYSIKQFLFMYLVAWTRSG